MAVSASTARTRTGAGPIAAVAGETEIGVRFGEAGGSAAMLLTRTQSGIRQAV
jgi:hypothetical protein